MNERDSLPLESNTYLAPLDGLVLQPLPFEQYRYRGLPELS